MSTIITTVAELDEAAPGSVIETDGTRFPAIRYTKLESGNWHMKHAVNTPPVGFSTRSIQPSRSDGWRSDE